MCWPDPLGLDMNKKMQDWSTAVLPNERERYDAIRAEIDEYDDAVDDAIEAMKLDVYDALFSDRELVANKLAYDQMVAVPA